MKKYSETKTISFAKENMDALDILNNVPVGQQSQFVCDALRFYVEHKDKQNELESLKIELQVQQKLLEMLTQGKNIGSLPINDFVEPQTAQISDNIKDDSQDMEERLELAKNRLQSLKNLKSK